MAHLPVGWTVSNKDGASAGPARRPSPDLDGDSGSDDGEQGLDIAPDSPGWEDVEAEEDEDLSIKCLLCEHVFHQKNPMLDHCSMTHGLDFMALVKQHALDFYGMIKLVNYIRAAAANESASVDASDADLWKDDKFLQPVMEEDALLFSLDELVEDGGEANGKVPDYDDMEAARAAREQRTELDDVPE